MARTSGATVATVVTVVAVVTAAACAGVAPHALAQSGPHALAHSGPVEGYRLFGHDNGLSAIIQIDTATGLASIQGPTGFASGASGMATSLGTVYGPGGTRFAKGTFFGVIGDNDSGNDYVTVFDPVIGTGTKLVPTSRAVSGRGVAFGPDGTSFYMIEGNGQLSTVNTITGAVESVGLVTDVAGRTYAADNLEWDDEHGVFVALMSRSGGGGGGDDYYVHIDPDDASATVIDTVSGLSVCTLVRAPNAVPGPGGVDWPEGTWFTINSGGTLVTLDVDVAGGSVDIGQVVGSLGAASSNSVCGTAFTLPVVPPTPTPAPATATPLPTVTPVPTSTPRQRTGTPAPSASPLPSSLPPTATPTATPRSTAVPQPDCICDLVYARVPIQVVQDAVANPTNFRGWMEPLDPGKPPSPANPPRTCLSLLNLNVDYHPQWNQPVWRVGCQ
ncbi:MAG: hypothetical protein ACK2T6_02920 [Anaerolineae bacterium]